MTYEEALGATGRQVWSGLCEERKVEVLQALEDRAARESGRLSRPVVAEWLHTGQDGVVLGTFNPSQQTISVNASQLGEGASCGEDSSRMVETIFHEGRHAYQHDVVEGRIPHADAEEARAWAENLEPGGYVRFWENPRAYFAQPVEADARRFAEARSARLEQERSELLMQEESNKRDSNEASEDRLERARRAFEGRAAPEPRVAEKRQRAAHVVRMA